MEVFATHYDELVPRGSRWLRRWVLPSGAGRDDNTPSGSRRNIAHHYDLSNELFELFLDETMTYSSALFEPGERRDTASLLAAPNAARSTVSSTSCQRWIRDAAAGDRHRVGRAGVRAGRRGAEVVTITLSERAA